MGLFAFIFRTLCVVVALGLVAACTNVPSGSGNPFRQGAFYQQVAPNYGGEENVRVLSSGELHFNN